MVAKTNGAEFKRFYQDPEFWPDGAFHEDVIFKVDGETQEDGIDVQTLRDASVVTIEGGIVLGVFNDNEPSVEAYFKRWKKQQTLTSFLVECDVSKLEAVKAAITAAGGRVA